MPMGSAVGASCRQGGPPRHWGAGPFGRLVALPGEEIRVAAAPLALALAVLAENHAEPDAGISVAVVAGLPQASHPGTLAVVGDRGRTRMAGLGRLDIDRLGGARIILDRLVEEHAADHASRRAADEGAVAAILRESGGGEA